jgi:hypothetical protein
LRGRLVLPDEFLSKSLIGKLILRGDPDWCLVLFSTNPLVKALLKFKGQGCINQVYKAGSWTKSAEDKVLQMLKDTLEKDEGDKGSETQHQRTMQSKKRHRASKAAVDTIVDAALRDGGQRLNWMIAWSVTMKWSKLKPLNRIVMWRERRWVMRSKNSCHQLRLMMHWWTCGTAILCLPLAKH